MYYVGVFVIVKVRKLSGKYFFQIACSSND